jgi:tripartite-type tricarboxylate transporter receptor subunit TctC
VKNIVRPNVPTVAESGFPGFNLMGWRMLAAPIATPQAVINKLIEAGERTLKNPEIANFAGVLSSGHANRICPIFKEKWR